MPERKRIVYCTQVYFLDAAVEYIRLLTEKGYEVHVLIELSHKQLRTNILDVNVDLEKHDVLTSFHEVRDAWGLPYLSAYFEHCVSVHFVVYTSKNIAKTWRTTRILWKYIESIQTDYIHYDDFSLRCAFSLPFFIRNRKKLIANIHDPKTHSGEFDWKREVLRKVLFRTINKYVVFSEYSKNILQPQLPKKNSITVMKLMPYTVYRYFLPLEDGDQDTYITFVGRISPYKGVELFVEAAKRLTIQLPDVQFLIAGKLIDGYNPDFIKNSHSNIRIENKFLSNSEMVSMISKSKVVVCPYKDATQSGVIMTAHALGCPVIVTDSGGLPEYVISGESGIVVNGATIDNLYFAIKDFIDKHQHKVMEKTLENLDFLNNYEEYNAAKLSDLYS